MTQHAARRKTASAIRVAQSSAPVSPSQVALTRLSQNFSIELAPFADGDKALAFQRNVLAIAVRDVDTHRHALELLRVGKALRRGAEDHWRKVTRWLDERKREVMGIMAMDLELVEPGIAAISHAVLAYESAERDRVRQEQERQRIENERLAKEQREKELADLERQALEAEATCEGLSAREQAFVTIYVEHTIYGFNAVASAKLAGYKDPHAQGLRLLAAPKIQNAIEAKCQAIAIRKQAAAVTEKPVEVAKVEVVSHIAKVAGTHTVTTWTGECYDQEALIDAVLRDVADRKLLMPNQVEINSLARSLHENLDRIPGLRHIKSETKAG